MTTRRRAAAVVGLALVGFVAAGCDHGSALLVENQTDSDYIVRTTGTNYTSEAGNYRDQVVAIAPANSKRVVVFYGFTGGFRSNDLEILRPDCSPIYSQPFYGDIGSYVVIVLRGLSIRPIPFVVSFTAYFIGLYLVEALYLKRLFQG